MICVVAMCALLVGSNTACDLSKPSVSGERRDLKEWAECRDAFHASATAARNMPTEAPLRLKPLRFEWHEGDKNAGR